MNDWQKEREEKARHLRDFVQQIANRLREPWQVSGEDKTDIVNGAGAKLHISIDRDRVSIFGGLHIGKNGSYETVWENGRRAEVPHITVALTRGVDTVAKEIQRRVLPEYLRILALAQAQIERSNQRRANIQAHLTKLAAITHDFLNFREEPERESYSFYETNGPHGDVQVHGDGEVSLKFTCSMEEGETLLRYLYREQSKEGGAQ